MYLSILPSYFISAKPPQLCSSIVLHRTASLCFSVEQLCSPAIYKFLTTYSMPLQLFLWLLSPLFLHCSKCLPRIKIYSAFLLFQLNCLILHVHKISSVPHHTQRTAKVNLNPDHLLQHHHRITQHGYLTTWITSSIYQPLTIILVFFIFTIFLSASYKQPYWPNDWYTCRFMLPTCILLYPQSLV